MRKTKTLTHAKPFNPQPSLQPSQRELASSSLPSGDLKSVFHVEDSDPFDIYSYRLSGIVHSSKTAYQDVLIADTYNWDRVLILDGSVQSTEEDESLYHEMLVQPAMLCHPAPENILVIGGGEGATLREVLAHRSVKTATMVDLDQEVVELCQRYLPQWHQGAFEDKRTRLIFQDGRKFIENDHGQYDVVIVDVVDMLDNGPAQSLYTRQFYELLRRRLKPNALVVIQGLEFSFLDYQPHAALSRTLKAVFPEVHSYRVDIPSFLSAWGFLIASDWLNPKQLIAHDIDQSIQDRLPSKGLKHVDGDFLKSTFNLCRKTQSLLREPGPLLEDGKNFEPMPLEGQS